MFLAAGMEDLGHTASSRQSVNILIKEKNRTRTLHPSTNLTSQKANITS